jgi:hypothetical protein
MPDNLYRTPEYSDALEDLGIEILHGPWTESLAVWISENGADVDEVLVSRPDIAAKYLPLLRQHCRAPLVFYGHDLHSARMRLEPGALQDSSRLKEISRMEDLERNVWRLVDVALYPSEDEAEAVRRMEPRAKVRAIQPYALSAPQTHAETAPASSTIIFVGGFRHTPMWTLPFGLQLKFCPLSNKNEVMRNSLLSGPIQRRRYWLSPALELRYAVLSVMKSLKGFMPRHAWHFARFALAQA